MGLVHLEDRVAWGQWDGAEGPGWGLGIGGRHQAVEWVWRVGAGPDDLPGVCCSEVGWGAGDGA